MATDLEALAFKKLARLESAGLPAPARLTATLRLLAKYRTEVITLALQKEIGDTVQHGPFAGMQLLGGAAEGCYIPKLLGCYEMELHPAIEGLAGRHYDTIIDIGCAEGYYAVGFARLLPAVTLHARDTDPRARGLCQRTAELNGVSGRLHIDGEFHGADFGTFAEKRTLVFCDIEGAEVNLLDPGRYPALRGMDVIVEMHDSPAQSISDLLVSRFRDTHDIEILRHQVRDIALPACLDNASELDRFLAVWEWRGRPTPWGVMRSRRPAGGP